ncbi:MAG: PepSY domain-containing protein [Microbispora sp.]|nr:PepSY domain-containing protein [Microbispora sp.]
MRHTTKIALAAAVTVTALAAGATAATWPATAAATANTAAADASASRASAGAAAASTGITRHQAIAIAKRRVPGARVTEVEREWEHGHRTWKVELRKGRLEYKVYVAIATGRIVKFRVDHDD